MNTVQSERWPISHTFAGAAFATILPSPGDEMSHYLLGVMEQLGLDSLSEA